MLLLEIVCWEEPGPSSFRIYFTTEVEAALNISKDEICLVWHCPSSFLFSSFVDYLIKIPVLFHIFWIKWWRKKKRLRQRRLENSVQFLPWRKYRKTIFAHFSCSRLSMRHTSAPIVCNSWNLSNTVKLSHQCWFWYKCSLPFVGEKNVEHFNLSNCWW